MVSAVDFITIPYTNDMTQGGIQYASQWLLHNLHSKENRRYKFVRDIITKKAVELAFKRHLNQHKIPHTIALSTPFSDPDSYDIQIGGRRCCIKSYLLTRKKQIRDIHRSPERLLQAQAFVSAESMDNNQQNDQDIFIFAFVTGLITPNKKTLAKAISAGQPIYLIHFLPSRWAQSKFEGRLGKLAIQSNMSNTLGLGLFGQDEHHKFQTEQLIVEPMARANSNKIFSTLIFCTTTDPQDRTIRLYSPNLNESYLIEPIRWQNIWVYGLKIILAGYITGSDFGRKAEHLPQGSRVFQYHHTREENFSMPIQELHPLNDLFTQAKAWFQIQRTKK